MVDLEQFEENVMNKLGETVFSISILLYMMCAIYLALEIKFYPKEVVFVTVLVTSVLCSFHVASVLLYVIVHDDGKSSLLKGLKKVFTLQHFPVNLTIFILSIIALVLSRTV